MGLEDYGVVLKSRPKKSLFPGDCQAVTPAIQGAAGPKRPTADGIAIALESMGFMRQPPPVRLGPARLAAASESEVRLTARQKLESADDDGASFGEYIVEALVRSREDGNSGQAEFESLSLRFAVCQPEGAGWHFLKLVKRMCVTLSLAVVYGERTYSPDVFWAFRLRANEQIRGQEETWQQLFDQDTERLPIAVDDMWSHFLKKHPGLVESDDLTISTGKTAMQPCADRDMEETLPPKVARAISARRPSDP